jgi:hypothetical protein
VPLDAIAKLLCACDHVYWHTLLTCPNENHDLKALIESTEVDLLDVLVVDEQ